MALIQGRFFQDSLLTKSDQAVIGELFLPEFIDQGQKNKYSHDDNEEIFFLEKPGSDDDFATMLADGYLCVDGLVTVGTTDDFLCLVLSFGYALFQFTVNVIGPFTVHGGTFSLEGHRVRPDECLAAIGAGNLLHGWSPSALLANGSFPLCQGLTAQCPRATQDYYKWRQISRCKKHRGIAAKSHHHPGQQADRRQGLIR
jgi:hypothetical protein